MATLSQPTTARNELFKQLKPLCVQLSRLALRATDKIGSSKEIVSLVDNLTTLWEAQASQDASVLDEKLAEYVFFPLSHILRGQDQYPVRVREVIIKLLRVLIQYGWKSKISKDLSQQLLIFFTFTVGGVPGEEAQKQDVPEETATEVYRSLTALVTATGTSIAAPPPSATEPINPALGYSLTVVFDGIAAAASLEAQIAALEYIRTIFTTVLDDRVLATFLPGTVSTISKILSTPQQRMPRRVIIKGLEVLRIVLVTVLDDMKMLRLVKALTEKPPEESSPAQVAKEPNPGDVLTASWLRATVPQVKISLSAVLKLRNHDHDEVHIALYRLCIQLLNDCHSSLADCQSMLVESAMIVEDEDISLSTTETSLRELAVVYPELGDAVKSVMYNWIISLPRIMQSTEERPKQSAIRKILNGSKLITALGVDSSTLEDAVGSALKDSLMVLISNSGPAKVLNEVDMDIPSWTSTDIIKYRPDLDSYQPVLLGGEGQRDTRAEFNKLISRIGPASQQVKLATEIIGYLQDSEGTEQIASYWLSFELLKAAATQSSDVDAFINMDAFTEVDQESMLIDELYQFSSSVLSSHSDAPEMDWRLEAIALEAVAFVASRMQEDFRGELIDVLYPIATFLGSPNPQLRRHAIITLNKIAASTKYSNVSELIIDNVDYMVNSVSLRLNTFDISPASTKVLTMMIRLTGPKLIPFLDDVVVSIFAALDNYHGYSTFVESLFAVLSEVVNQGVKSNQLLLEEAGAGAIDHKKKSYETVGISGILAQLENQIVRAQATKQEQEDEEAVKGHVKGPWGSQDKGKQKSKSFLESLEDGLDDNNEDDPPPTDVEKPKASNTPTYKLLSRITTLAQHYLTSPTPALRKSLLELLATVSPALAPDEEAFLPLVNDFWPVVISRLQDPEAFVVIAACQALASLCAAAGDFLASRFKTEWAEGLGTWCQRCRDEAARSKSTPSSKIGRGLGGPGTYPKGVGLGDGSKAIILPTRNAAGAVQVQSMPTASGGLGRFAQAAQIWEAVVMLLTTIVSHVRVDDDMFDQMLEILGDEVPRNESVRRGLEIINADAVWLALYRRGMVEMKPAPKMEAINFAIMDTLTSQELAC